MSEAQQEMESESPSSAEDKFFGIKTQIGKKEEPVEKSADSDVEYEIVDDRPLEDRRPSKYERPEDESEEELTGVSDSVKKRIDKLRFDYHNERREKEAAIRMRDEAVNVAHTYSKKNQEYEALIGRGEEVLADSIKEKAQIALDNAKASYKKAYEEGDTDKVVDAQEQMFVAQQEIVEADKYKRDIGSYQENQKRQQIAQQEAAQAAQAAQQQPPQAELSPAAKEWADQNPWFMADGYEEMTSLAYGTHTANIKQGIPVDSPEYFERVNSRLRQAFPDFDWQGSDYGRNATSTASPPTTVVATSTRNNGAKPRKVKLTSTQAALAKRLGLTNEQYAQQLIKEGKHV